jgi:hypothetical protein
MEPAILSEARKANEITICEFYNSFVPPQYAKRLVEIAGDNPSEAGMEKSLVAL